ncbi:MAG TPA: FG-GAP-like repeat-containing protein [Bryobacterales bacterium]|jgi:uncharacterized protein (TIGR03437 family)|nr:FG-GAP-like repeat-containing protein [Bryobacterales bacterium]
MRAVHIAVLLGAAVRLLTAQTVSFISRGAFAAGASPSALAVADFNGDGLLDVAVANGGFSSTVSILLSLGQGQFRSPMTFAAGASPRSILTGDFNGDGKPDLVTANSGSNDVSVLLGSGAGIFLPPLRFLAGEGPRFVAAGDFNRDGKPDLVVANANSNNVSLLLGLGRGLFLPPINFAVGRSPSSLVVGDFNRDGKLDLAVANSGSNDVSILLGSGDGRFLTALNFPAGSGPVSIAAGDFNGDGIPDLAVADGGFADNVSVLQGIGNGVFQAARNFRAGGGLAFITTGDVNQDGKPDLIVANGGFGNTVSILLGAGFENFLPPISIAAGSSPAGIALGDVNGDRMPDLLVANSNAGQVSVLLNSSLGVAPSLHAISAASGAPVVAPESIASVFGPSLAGITQSAAAEPLPKTLGGITVEVQDSRGTRRPAPLFFVSPNQINFEIPADLAPGEAAISILTDTGVSFSATAQVNLVAPGLFTADGTGNGVAAAVVSRSHLADPTEEFLPAFQCVDGQCEGVPIELSPDTDVFLSLFGTGLRNRSSLSQVTVAINGVPAPVLYAGPQGSFTGLDQVNVLLPQSLRGSGNADVILTVDGQTANPVRINIK